MTPEVRSYLHRIAYDGPTAATIDTLTGIVRAHVEAIPFENLDPLLDRPVRLDPASLFAKLVHGRRGGWCFEHNLLLQHVLDELGYSTTGLGARVVWTQAPDVVAPRSHMALRVDLDDGPHLVDVGFGGQTLTAPLRLLLDVEQPTPHGRFRLVGAPGGEILQQVRIDGEWRATYRFDLVPHLPVDYEAPNHYLSTHPDSHFRHGLLAARCTADHRHALRDRELTVYRGDGTVERSRLGSVAEVCDVLDQRFGVTVPDPPALEAAFARMA